MNSTFTTVYFCQTTSVISPEGELTKIGVEVKDPDYLPDATFYLLADLSSLAGKPLHKEAARVLGKCEENPEIQTDVEIAYHLLFEKQLALTPLSFFGLDPSRCLMRITCSDDEPTLKDLSRRLESAAREGPYHRLPGLFHCRKTC